jgi:protein-L-isoaspartate(D-aspartate) O-methyltransferase
MDWERARFNMVEQQIRTWEVFDLRVLDALMRVKREAFVPVQHQKLAFADVEIPLPCGERMLRPLVEAKVLQALTLEPHERVLEIGTGSGFFAAALAYLAKEVVSVERHGALAEWAAERLRGQRIGNVTVYVGDGLLADPRAPWLSAGRFDVITFSGGVRQLPRWLLDHLNVGGRLFAFVGQPPVMEAVRVVCTAPAAFQEEVVFETVVPPLAEPTQPQALVA